MRQTLLLLKAKKYCLCLAILFYTLSVFSAESYKTHFVYLNHTSETYKAIYRHRETCEGHIQPHASEMLPTGAETRPRAFADITCPVEPVPSPIVNHSRIEIRDSASRKVSLVGSCHIVGLNRFNFVLHRDRVDGIVQCSVTIEKSNK